MYIQEIGGLGQSQPICEAAATDLERLETYLKLFKKESEKTYGDPKRLKLLGSLVFSEAESISKSLIDYIDRGCCEPELKTLEAQVRALPWTFQRTRGGNKVVRIERFRDIEGAYRILIKALQEAQGKALFHVNCSTP